MERITGLGARVAVLVLDACRNNPLQGSQIPQMRRVSTHR
jgi:hypothetical protein